MLHSKHISLAPGQTALSATVTNFMVNKGVIYRVWVAFPPGCAGLVKLRILHQGHPFLPVDADAFIRGDDYIYEYPVFFEILDTPELITVTAWNEDDTYSHDIDVQLLILPKEWIQPVGAYEGVISALRSLFVRPV